MSLDSFGLAELLPAHRRPRVGKHVDKEFSIRTGSSGLDCLSEIKYVFYGSNTREGCDQYPPGAGNIQEAVTGVNSSPNPPNLSWFRQRCAAVHAGKAGIEGRRN